MDRNKTYEDKLKAAQLAVAGLQKQYGDTAVYTGGQKSSTFEPVDVISSGNIGLDLALGIGGFPRGRVSEISGAEGLGKSLLAMGTVAEAQKKRGLTAYIDMEHALDPSWCKRQGIDWDSMHLAQPRSGEEALTIADKLICTGSYDLVVIDSVAALTPQAEVDGEIGDQYVGLQARMMGQAMRIMNPHIGETNTAVIFINQLRDKIGPMAMGGSVTPGGRALKFYSSVRVELRKIQNITNKTSGEILGLTVKANVIKNKVAPPFKTTEYNIIHGQGFDNEGIALAYALKYELVAKSGAFYYLLDDNGNKADKNFAQGDLNASKFLRDNPDVFDELTNKVKVEYRSRQGYFTDTLNSDDVEDDDDA